jgi:uncharacterized protein YraI
MGQPQLQSLLETAAGGNKVYFQPPANVTMSYPCIVYERDRADTKFADNAPYSVKKRYSIKVIDADPNSPMWETVAALPTCIHDRHYTVGNLHHDVFNIYF